MDINITKFFNEAEPSNYSASRAERGDNGGPETWAAANEAAAEFLLLDTAEKVQALRDHARGFGAWEQKEIDGWTIQECNALLIQMISGDIREVPDMEPGSWDWAEYEKLAEKGTISSRLCEGTDGEIYYYLGD
jgi:hypothetical protein